MINDNNDQQIESTNFDTIKTNSQVLAQEIKNQKIDNNKEEIKGANSLNKSLDLPDQMADTAHSDSFGSCNLALEQFQTLKIDNLTKENVRIAVIGNVDSGKSTLTAVLSCPDGMNDDGRGALREKIFNFAHEKSNGRTTSIATEIIGFDSNGNQVFSKKKDLLNCKKKVTWPEIVEGSTKVINMIDLCGHEKYLKTTLFGMSGQFPQYAMLVVGANMGVSRMTKEHIGIAMSLKIPIFVVVTKVDIAPENIY